MAIFRARTRLAETYPSVALPNQRLKPFPRRARGPFDSLRGRSSVAARAGLSVRALNAEMSTENAIVSANC